MLATTAESDQPLHTAHRAAFGSVLKRESYLNQQQKTTNREICVVDLHDAVVVEPEVGDGERHGLGDVGQAAVREVHQLQHLAAERHVRHRHQRVLVQE